MRYVFPISVLLFLLIANSSQAQNASQVHHHDPSPAVDGAVNPELIPDLTAYRLFFIVMSQPPDATHNQSKRQAARLERIGLTDADQNAVVAILANFTSDYQSLINAYNEAATAAWTHQERTDPGYLLLRRDGLVQATVDALKRALSADGWTRLEAHVLNEKKFMKISASEVKQ